MIFASAQSAIFLAVTAPQDNIAIKPSMSTVRRFSVLYSVVFLMMHIPPFLRILLHHLPDSGFMPVVSTFSCCFWFYLMMNLFLFGVLASVRIGGVNVTVDLYQNFSECWQRLLEHTSRCRSIFDFHILLSGTAVELCVVLSSPKGTYTVHLIFNVRKRS